MPLPDNVSMYVERKKKRMAGRMPPRPNITYGSCEDPISPDYIRGYVGRGHRMSGEEADRQLMEIMKHW
jgi:hypothetical protein